MIHTVISVLVYLLLGLALALVVAYGYNTLFTPKYSQSYDKIIFISGSYTQPYLLGPWRSYLQSRFPNSDIEIISGYYGYRDTADERAQLVEMKNQVVSRLRTIDNNAEVAVVAYSYGGVLLDAAYQELARAGQDPQLARVVTVAAPLAEDEFFRDQEFINSRDIIGFSYDRLPNHRIVCGRFDSLITCRRTQYQSSQPTKSVWSNHYTFMLPQIVGGRIITEELVVE
jgi:hypothetical protein